jgi:hypothetical protein
MVISPALALVVVEAERLQPIAQLGSELKVPVARK